MKYLLLICTFVSMFCCFGQTWEQTLSFPGTPRDDGTHFTIATKHYVGTGREVGFGCTRDFYSFDESTLNWATISSLPIGKERQYASTVSWNGKGYLFGGVDCAGNYQNDFWCYDPNADSWSALNTLPSAGRGGMVQFVIQDALYVIGGRNDAAILNEIWCYDFINETWIQKNDLPFDGIWTGVAFTYQDIGFIGLGKNNLNNQTDYNSAVWSYESSTDSWTIVPNLNLGQRAYVGSAQTDSTLFLFGGLSPSNQLLTSFERIDLVDFSIHVLPDFSSIPRKGGCPFLVQNDFYYSTGVSTDTRFNETWRLANVTELVELSGIELNIYPNPTYSGVTLKCNEPMTSIQITDIFGKKVFEVEVHDTYFYLETSVLPVSRYIVTIQTVNHTIKKPIILLR